MQFGAFLQHSCGLKKGDRIAVMMPNTLQYPIAIHGALRAGFTVVNTNPLYTARELEHQLTDSGATVIVILENFAHVLQEVIAHTPIKHVIVTSVGEMLGFPKGNIVDFVVRHKRKQVKPFSLPGSKSFKQALKEGSKVRLQPVTLTHADIAFLQYTGGTTGVAKGAMLTHGNMVANVLQALEWIGPSFPRDPATLITALPLYHIFALTANCLLFVRLGWRNVLITNPRDFPAFVAELRKYKFTYISGVNTLVQRAAAHARIRHRRFQHPAPDAGRRHGRAGSRRQAMEGSHREDPDAGVGTHRNFACCVHQPARRGFQRVDRIPDSVDRNQHP